MRKIILFITVWSLWCAGVFAQNEPVSLLIYKGVSSENIPVIADSVPYSEIDSMQIGNKWIRFYHGSAIMKQYFSTDFDSIVVHYDRSGLFPTIWERMSQEKDSKMKEYLFSWNIEKVNEDYSIPGYIDSAGQTVFLDSVMIYGNQLWEGVTGFLNDEDSSYIAILLNNEAFVQGREIPEKNYMYSSLQAPYFEEGLDSLLRMKNVKITHSLLRSLFFVSPQSEENTEADFYRTVKGDLIQKTVLDDLLLRADSSVKCQNGILYFVSSYPSGISSAWRKTIVAETEDPYRLISIGENQSVQTITADGASQTPLFLEKSEGSGKGMELSGGAFLHVKHSSTQSATATFGNPNTLSGSYEVWVTFAPSSIVHGEEALPLQVNAQIDFSVINAMRISSKRILCDTFEVDPFAVTHVKIAKISDLAPCYEGFMASDQFHYSENENPAQTDFFLKNYGVKVRLSNATSLLDDQTDPDLYIDCLRLVPCE